MPRPFRGDGGDLVGTGGVELLVDRDGVWCGGVALCRPDDHVEELVEQLDAGGVADGTVVVDGVVADFAQDVEFVEDLLVDGAAECGGVQQVDEGPVVDRWQVCDVVDVVGDEFGGAAGVEAGGAGIVLVVGLGFDAGLEDLGPFGPDEVEVAHAVVVSCCAERLLGSG